MVRLITALAVLVLDLVVLPTLAASRDNRTALG
jgi:hypothetical protein